ncbi:hypothetical protein DYB32_010012 [Aphanomyces invadans]|nr:hypothetical protein DYB32_010012 [Aphanomyces invadans]
MKVIETKTWAYENMNANKETRIQLSFIFEHVVCMFKDKEDAERFRLFVQSKLVRSFVKANGFVDFRITRGTKTVVCIVDDKKYDLATGTERAVLAIEAAADKNNDERMYGVVTNFKSRHFLKRTDVAIERFDDSIRLEDPQPDLKRGAGRLYAMLKNQ